MKITDIKGTVTLNNNVEMPYLGLGVWKSNNEEEVVNAVQWAIEAGYRHIDTAMIYKNEAGVGEGLRQSGIDRKEMFVVSKVWNSDQGYESTLKAFETSLKKLQLDYLDLYLVHWPVAGKYKDTWRALEYLYEQGKVRAIGVSNFMQHHLEDLLPEVKVIPAVNQMEFHPRLIQQDLVDFCMDKGIRYEAWSPLMQGKVFNMEIFEQLANKYDKTIAQIVLRWDLQMGVITIPKSSNKQRIQENGDLFDFELSEEDMQTIRDLDDAHRVGPDPDNFDF